MIRENILDNPIVIFILFIIISTANILLPTHFIPLMFAGVLFIAFIKHIKIKDYYSLFWIILTFIVIESNQGLPLFSLLLVSLFMLIFLKTFLQQLISSSSFVQNLYIAIFYILIMLLHTFYHGFELSILSKIVFNIIVDIIIIGFLYES